MEVQFANLGRECRKQECAIVTTSVNDVIFAYCFPGWAEAAERGLKPGNVLATIHPVLPPSNPVSAVSAQSGKQ